MADERGTIGPIGTLGLMPLSVCTPSSCSSGIKVGKLDVNI